MKKSEFDSDIEAWKNGFKNATILGKIVLCPFVLLMVILFTIFGGLFLKDYFKRK